MSGQGNQEEHMTKEAKVYKTNHPSRREPSNPAGHTAMQHKTQARYTQISSQATGSSQMLMRL